MILEARSSLRRWTTVTVSPNLVRKMASSRAESPPPITAMCLTPEEEPVTRGARRDTPAEQALLGLQAEHQRSGPRRHDHRPGPVLDLLAGGRVGSPDPERTGWRSPPGRPWSSDTRRQTGPPGPACWPSALGRPDLRRSPESSRSPSSASAGRRAGRSSTTADLRSPAAPGWPGPRRSAAVSPAGPEPMMMTSRTAATSLTQTAPQLRLRLPSSARETLPSPGILPPRWRQQPRPAGRAGESGDTRTGAG